MIFLVAGEGPSDMGQCLNGKRRCAGADFQAGPMAIIIKQLTNRAAGFDLPDDAIEFVEHDALAAVVLPKNRPTSSFVPGKKAPVDTGYFYLEAKLLGHLAVQKSTKECPVAAVLFHDADGSRANKKGLWQEKWKSIQRGFAEVNCEKGIPMVAKPTSEAWLLCGMQSSPYQNCAALETTVSHSDKSPCCGKKLLKDAIAAAGETSSSFADLVVGGKVDAHRIDMPSYNEFKSRLTYVVTQMVGKITPKKFGADLPAGMFLT